MPELDYALLADYVRAEHGVAHVIGAGIDTVQPAQVPTAHNVGLLFRIEFTRQECGRPHRLEVIFMDIDGKRLAALTSVITPEWKKGLPVSWPVAVLGGVNLGIPLPAFGEYAFEVLINDTNKKTIRLRVLEQPSEPAAGDEAAGDG